MRIRVDRLTVEGPHGTVLLPTSFTVASGSLTVVHGEPSVGVTALGLALAGRIKPSSGTVALEDSANSNLREIAAVVDAPGVSEPDEALSLKVVIGEELALAKKPASKEDVLRWLASHEVESLANSRFEDLSPALRTKLLAATAASRPGVKILILVAPDRHTSDWETWLDLARSYATEGLAVAVLIATTPTSVLSFAPARIGHHDQPEPLLCQEPISEESPVDLPLTENEESAEEK